MGVSMTKSIHTVVLVEVEFDNGGRVQYVMDSGGHQRFETYRQWPRFSVDHDESNFESPFRNSLGPDPTPRADSLVDVSIFTRMRMLVKRIEPEEVAGG